MAKICDLAPVQVEFYIPDIIEEGFLYISQKFGLAIHLCACGCKEKTVTPIRGIDSWQMIENDGKITLRPSIGNFSSEKPYHAHYYITDNKIEWL